MRLNKNQQETLMYQSRLLFKHDNVETALDRSLAITIYTNEVFDTEHFKRAIFQKIHRAFYELLSNLVFEGSQSCGDLVCGCGFNSVFEPDAGDDFGEVIKAA